MHRDFSALERDDFDLLVVGGGVYGAWMAYDAALRGLRVALVERTDWAAGTSSASSKLIHGGLRYLERLQLRLVATSLGERKRLARLAPHHVRPLRFVIPVYRGAPVGRLRWALGLTLYDGLAGRGQPVPGHRRWAVHRLEHAFPFLRPEGLRGGFTYGDCQMDDARYVLEIVDGGMAAGVVAVNRAEAASPLRDGPRVVGAHVRDVETGAGVDVRATVTVDCSGPWGWTGDAGQGTVRRPAGTRLTKGVHLVMPPLPVSDAFLLLSPVDGRVCFLIPWYGRTLLGTTDTAYDGDPDGVTVDTGDVEYLLSVADAVLRLGWRARDVEASFAGLRVLPDEPGAPSAVSREWSLTRPSPGLVASVGGKYTTARADAARAVDAVMSQLGLRPGERPTGERAFPWAPAGGFDDWLARVTAEGEAAGLDEVTARAVALRHGTRVGEIHQRIADRPELAERLDSRLPFCRAEVIQAAAREMARSLDDVLRRRVPWLILSRPDSRVVRQAAALVASALAWTGERREAEAATVLRGPARVEGSGR